MIIIIEGNIGVGKSTLKKHMISYLETVANDRFRVVDVSEPVDRWIESGLLQSFYSDPDAYGFVFQNVAINDMFVNEMTASRRSEEGDVVVVMERSLASTTDVFVPVVTEILRSEGKDDRAELLNSIADEYDVLARSVFRDRKNVWRIYMSCEPEICQKRVLSRNRESECRITIDYLKRLHELHENLFCNPGGDEETTTSLEASSTLVKTAPMSVTCFGDGSSSLGEYISKRIDRVFPR